MSGTVDVFWTCGCYLHGDFTNGEPPECETSFTTEEDREDWESGVCAVDCPQCGTRLSKRDGHAEHL